MTDKDKEPPRRIDLRNEGVHWDLGESQSYGEYLQLDKVLSAQKPNSIEQDEMLFIIVHQVSELWMRLFLHELGAVFECVRRDNLDPSFKMLARISRLQEELLGAWSVLSTLTPFEYSSFRNTLGRSSGFQSVQYRLLEFMLGNKNRDIIVVHKRDPAAYERLERALKAPSIYDEVLRLLSRRGYGIPEELVERDFSEPYAASKAVTAAWLAVYHNAEKDWDLYELAERLTDLDQKFQLWRFHHLKTVERVIGYKPGTGGTGGVSYLAKALELKFFPELWHVRTSMQSMRRIASALIVSLGLSGIQVAAAQTGSDSIEYDKAVARVWGSITSTENVVHACMKRAPKSKKQIDAAYREWKTRYAPLIAEIDVRIDRVMNSSGAYSAEELAARKADVLKRGADRYEADLATSPAEQVKRECELLPGYFTTSSFVLETHFAQELALIRARPIPAEPRN